MASRLHHLLRRLDAVPIAPAAAFGVAAGTAAGALLLWQPTAPRLAIAAGLVSLAVPLAWVAKAAAEPVQTRKQRSSLLDMVPIEGGTFWMGSRDDDERAYEWEKPRSQVKVEPFWIAKYTVTQAQYQAVIGQNPSAYKGKNVPVTEVTWFDAVTFCNALSEREGYTPAYVIKDQDVTWNRAADGYRLPTEAEWEYAARAGTETAWSFGDDESMLGEHAWYHNNAGGQPHPVGEKKPNPWGLYDVHGNVVEWCWDWYGSYPYSGPPPAGSVRVLRGGSFVLDDPWNLRSASRVRSMPERSNWRIGFRCMRGSRRPSPPKPPLP